MFAIHWWDWKCRFNEFCCRIGILISDFFRLWRNWLGWQTIIRGFGGNFIICVILITRVIWIVWIPFTLVLFLQSPPSICKPRWNLCESHFCHNSEHHLFRLCRVGVFHVLFEPCFQWGGRFSCCVFTSPSIHVKAWISKIKETIRN